MTQIPLQHNTAKVLSSFDNCDLVCVKTFPILTEYKVYMKLSQKGMILA